MRDLSGKEQFKAVGELEVTHVPDGFVIYDKSGEKVHHLNPTAAVIFAVCDGKRTVDDIQSLLKDAYKIEKVPDLAPFFGDLEEAGLVCRT